MKKFLPFALGLSLVCTLVFTSQGAVRGAGAQSDLEARVDELEEALAAQTKVTKQVSTALDEVLEYLVAQAEAAKALAKVLDRSEELGFTAGINFESREVLLAGWHEALKAAQEDLPKPKNATKTGEKPRVRKRE